MTPAAIWTALTSKAGQWATAILAGALILWRIVVAIQAGAKAEVRADAAASEQRARRDADAAAADAQRDGADERLRSGRF